MLHLSGGVYHGQRLIGAAQMAQIHAPQVLDPSTDGHPIDHFKTAGYGMGWWVGTYRGLEASHHAGGRVGFGSDMWLFPDRQLGVVVLENLDYRDGIPLSRIALRIADYFLGVPLSKGAERTIVRHPPGNHEPVGARRQECSMTSPSRAFDTEHAAGAYHNDLLGDVKVVPVQGHLAVVFEPGSVADLVPAGRETFTACFHGYEQRPTPLRFTYGATGAIAGFVMGLDDSKATTDHETLAGRLYFNRLP